MERATAVLWVLLLVPALLWWQDSVLFVIIASIYANAKTDWGSAQAADNTELLDRLDRLEALIRDNPTRPHNVTPHDHHST